MIKFDCSKGEQRLVFTVSCFIAAQVISGWLHRDGWDFNMAYGEAQS